MDTESLISFFRTTDQTTAIVGQRQASTFLLLAAYSGHGEVPEPKLTKKSGSKAAKTSTPKKKEKHATPTHGQAAPPAVVVPHGNSVGLTVRIEINLPAGGDKKTYDTIFKSIKENLLDGNGA